jgi:hypothetical protein
MSVARRVKGVRACVLCAIVCVRVYVYVCVRVLCAYVQGSARQVGKRVDVSGQSCASSLEPCAAPSIDFKLLRSGVALAKRVF